MTEDSETPRDQATQVAGWCSTLKSFAEKPSGDVRAALRLFVSDFDDSQDRAWIDSIPVLQREAQQALDARPNVASCTAVLEYRLPMEARRADVVFLSKSAVVVIELKGKERAHKADIDQAAAYARDLAAYHRECQSRPVHAVVVPTRSSDVPVNSNGTWITGPSHLASLVSELASECGGPDLHCKDFLSYDAYRPLPSIVKAARELMHSGSLREITRARASTGPAIDYIARVAHDAARTKTRHLVLVTGVPGAGKTLVGMRAVHAHYLDDLAVARDDGKPTAPAIYLSGNRPLVTVLQFALKAAGGGGRTFVRHIKDYLDAHVPTSRKIPQQHLIVFDEAQRAFTPDVVAKHHKKWPEELVASEPELFIRLAERIPDWAVIVGLIGTGQEIHVGEEGGLRQWREAIERTTHPEHWVIHAPALVEEVFNYSALKTSWAPELHLDTELRFHLAADLHRLVGGLLEPTKQLDQSFLVAEASRTSSSPNLEGLRLYATRDLETAKEYLHQRYADDPDARYGLMASSKDKDLPRFGVDNDYVATNRVNHGAWYAADATDARSCRRLRDVVTEFGAQGLEVEMALVAWGGDFIRNKGVWDTSRAGKYLRSSRVVDPYQLRVNAYRVLLTRGRDGTILFVPPDPLWDETWSYLLQRGFSELRD